MPCLWPASFLAAASFLDSKQGTRDELVQGATYSPELCRNTVCNRSLTYYNMLQTFYHSSITLLNISHTLEFVPIIYSVVVVVLKFASAINRVFPKYVVYKKVKTVLKKRHGQIQNDDYFLKGFPF